MIPTQVPEPFHRDGWVYEEKVDGWRIVAYKDRDRVRLVRRHGVDHTRRRRVTVPQMRIQRGSTLVCDRAVHVGAPPQGQTRSLGSSVSRSQSPSRLTPRAVRARAAPGKAASHQAT